jgi:hypothetical protein
MIVASCIGTGHTVLRQLSALGARIECRGDKMVLRVGARPVPTELIAAARALVSARRSWRRCSPSPKALSEKMSTFGAAERL